MRTVKLFAAATFALLLAAACGTSNSGIGDIFGTGTSNQVSDVRGTVDSVDTYGHSILLTNASTYNALNPGSSGGSSLRVYYDNNTRVTFQGRSYRPEDLERGDQVTVHLTNASNNNQLMAQSMEVTYDVRNGGMASSGGPYSPGTYNAGSTLSGTVRSIDTYRHTITVDPGYGGSYVTVDYGTNTPVYYNGRTYTGNDLEVGDQINVRVSNGGTTRVGAQDITVTRSISGGNNTSSGTYGSSTSSRISTIRGTVQYVDTVHRTIQLSNTSWMSGFQTNTSGNTFLIHYDTTARVDVNGSLYPLSNLERGDVIDVTIENSGSTNLAQRISLVRDVNQR